MDDQYCRRIALGRQSKGPVLISFDEQRPSPSVGGMFKNQFILTTQFPSFPDDLLMWNCHRHRGSLGRLATWREHAPDDSLIQLQHEDDMLRTGSFLEVCKDLRLITIGFNTKRHLVISICQRPHVIAVFADAAGMGLPVNDNLVGPLFKFPGHGPGTHSCNHTKLGNSFVTFFIQHTDSDTSLPGFNLFGRWISLLSFFDQCLIRGLRTVVGLTFPHG